MVIYVDELFLENFIMNYIILYITAYFSKIKSKWYRLSIASALGATYVILTYIVNISIYNSLISKDSDVPKKLGIKAPCYVIHYNPWLVMASNNGQLLQLYKNIRAKNSKVVELNNDINRLASVITKVRISNIKQKGSKSCL